MRIPIPLRDIGKAGVVYDPASAPTVVGAEHPTADYAVSGSPTQTTRWVFDRDFATFGISFTPPSGGVSLHTQLGTVATQIQGVGWAFTSSFNGLPLTGALANRSSAFFEQDLRPRASAGILPPLPPIIRVPPFDINRDPLCLTCPDIGKWITFGDPTTLGPGEIITTKPGAGGTVINPGFTSAVYDLFRSVGGATTFVPAAEAAGALATSNSGERGAFLNAATGVVSKLVLDEAGNFQASTVGVPALSITNDVLSFSGKRGELYLLGGSGATARLRIVEVVEAGFSNVPISGVTLGVPLAITFQGEDQSLYAVDRLASGALRVLRVGSNGVASELGRINNPGTSRSIIHLAAVPDGTLLLSASGNSSVHPLHIILQPSVTSVTALGYLIEARPGQLLVPPTASGSTFELAKKSTATPFSFTELTRADFIPLGSVPLASTEAFFKIRSNTDSCPFTNVASSNDCTGVRTLAVYASNRLDIADRATTRTTSNSFSPLANGGTGETNIGVDALLGSVFSKGAVTLRDRARVNGFVRGGSSVTLQNGASVSGTILRNVPVNIVPLSQFTLEFPTATSGNVSLEPDTQLTLDSGFYADASIKSRARLSLTTGVYSFRSLTFEPDAILSLDTSAGPILIYVETTFIFRGTIQNNAGPRADFLVAAFGVDPVSLERPFIGTVVAPNARIILATTSSPHIGSFFGKEIEMRPGAVVVHDPFNYAWTP